MSRNESRPPDPNEAADSGRDNRGRFAPGNPGGPGRPPGHRAAEYRAAIRDAVQPDHFKLIFQRLVQMAVKDGDVAAARLLTERCLGPLSYNPLGDGYGLEIPGVQSFQDLLRVSEILLRAVLNGTAPVETAEKLFSLLAEVRNSYQTEVLEERVRALEGTSGTE